MTIKKSIFVLTILAVLIFGCLAGFYLGQVFKLTLSSKGFDLIPASASPCPSLQAKPSLLSEETKKTLSDRENFKAGLAESYKGLPLYPGIGENEVWTFLKPAEGIIYVSSGSPAETVSFYETKLKEEEWTEKTEEEVVAGIIHLTFIKGEKKLNIFAYDKVPNFLPKELGLKQGTFISLRFSR